MVKLLGLFLMGISAYSYQLSGGDMGFAQVFFIGIFIYFSDTLFTQIFSERREEC